MNSLIHFIKEHAFELAAVLCFALPPVGLFIMLVFSLSELYRHIKNKRLFSSSPVSLFFLCLLAATTGAAVQMGEPLLLAESLRILFYWGIFLKIMNSGTRGRFKHFRWIVIGCGLYGIFIGWLPKMLSDDPVLAFLTGTELFGFKHYNRLIGSTYNPNFTMFLLLIGISFLFAEMLKDAGKKDWKNLIWKCIPLFFLSKGVFDTGSRAGFISMICIYFIFFFRWNKWIFGGGLLFLALGAGKLAAVIPRVHSIEGSLTGREKIWYHSYKIFETHFLFGTTPLGFGKVYASLFHKNIYHAHDIFIGFFVEYGAIGGIAFLAVLVMGMFKLGRLFFIKRNYRYLNIFLLSLPVIVLTGFLDEPVFSPQIGMLAVVLLSYWEWYSKRMFQPHVAFLNRLNVKHNILKRQLPKPELQSISRAITGEIKAIESVVHETAEPFEICKKEARNNRGKPDEKTPDKELSDKTPDKENE